MSGKLTARRSRLPLACITASLLLSAVALAADGSLADLVPADAIAHLSVPDVPALMAKARAAPQAGLLREPAFRRAAASELRRIRQLEAAAATFLGSAEGRLDRVFTGPLSVSVLPPVGGEPRILLLAAVPERAEQILAMLEALAALGEGGDGDGPLTRSEFGRHVVYALRDVPGTPAQEAGTSALRLCLTDEILAVAISPGEELMREHLDVRDEGTTVRLGSRGDYIAARRATGPEGDILLFLDLGAIGEAVSTGMASGLGQALGVADRNVAAFAVRATDEGIAAEGFVSSPGPRQGLLKALSSATADLRPPEFVTADAALFAAVSFDLSVLWRDAFAALERTDADAVATIRQALTALPVNVERDIVGALGKRWLLVGSAAGDGRPRFALCVDLEDPRSFRRAWGAITAGYPPLIDPVVTEIEGSLVYRLNVGRRRAGDPVGPERCLVLGLDHVVLTNSTELAAAVAGGRMGEGAPLRENESFRQLSRRAGPAPAVVLYSTGRPAWRAAAQAADLAESALDVIEEYASPALLAGSWTEDGLRVHGFMPYPRVPPADVAGPR